MNSVFDCRLSGVETNYFFSCKLFLVALVSDCFGYDFSIFNKHIRYVAIGHVNTIDKRIRYITKCIKSPPPPPPGGLGCCRDSIVVYLLFYAPPIVSGGSVLVFVLVCITLTFLVL